MTDETGAHWILIHDRRAIDRRLRGIMWGLSIPVIFVLVLMNLGPMVGRGESPSWFSQSVVVASLALLLAYAARKARILASTTMSVSGVRWLEGTTTREMAWEDVAAVIPDSDRLQLKDTKGQSVIVQASATLDWPSVRKTIDEGTRQVAWSPSELAPKYRRVIA